jgi:dihydroflavonol-4-reductase
MKAIPKISFGIVDVRDVADLHIRAMTSSAANDQRFLASSGDPLTLHDIALLLKQKLGEKAKQVSTKVLPNWVVQIAALFNPAAKDLVPQLNRIKNSNNEKANKLLGWSPRSPEEAILASVESILQFEQ